MRKRIPKDRRRLTQILAFLAANSYLPGFLRGTIYQGPLKSVCVPFLNCYSCPGAIASCPVGAVQSLAVERRLSLYVTGLTLAFGSIAGRAICGWLCPAGLGQDLLSRCSRHKLTIPRPLLWTKYLVLLLLIPLAAFLTGQHGIGSPYFCQYVCPTGTLQAGLPLLALNPGLRELAGALFSWKLAVALAITFAAIFTYRPFCRILCPLGALYGLLNPVSINRMQIDEHRCDQCGACARACPMDLEPRRPNSPECIRCLVCARACPRRAIRLGISPAASLRREEAT